VGKLAGWSQVAAVTEANWPCCRLLTQCSRSPGPPQQGLTFPWDIEHLGAVETGQGFAFPTATRRAVAAEILGEKYETRYFEVVYQRDDEHATRLLIAESDEDLADGYRRYFTRKGFDVEVASKEHQI